MSLEIDDNITARTECRRNDILSFLIKEFVNIIFIRVSYNSIKQRLFSTIPLYWLRMSLTKVKVTAT